MFFNPLHQKPRTHLSQGFERPFALKVLYSTTRPFRLARELYSLLAVGFSKPNVMPKQEHLYYCNRGVSVVPQDISITCHFCHRSWSDAARSQMWRTATNGGIGSEQRVENWDFIPEWQHLCNHHPWAAVAKLRVIQQCIGHLPPGFTIRAHESCLSS